MTRRKSPPSYRLHKARDCAVVTINGKNHYLGAHGSPGSREKYARLIAEWNVSEQNPKSPPSDNKQEMTVVELLLPFWRHVKKRYVKNGKPTSERSSFETALGPVNELYGKVLIRSFGPLALIACRQKLIEAGLCRKRINQHTTRIRQAFKWGVAREIVPESVWRALCAVEGLRYGEALETERVKPVPDCNIELIKAFVSPQIWAMVNLQVWTACRPGEAIGIRTIDLDMRNRIWEYRPGSHKTEHHQKERIIYLGPHAQEFVIRWLKSNLTEYLFSPREARDWHHAERSKNRITPMTPSHRKRKPKRKPRRAPGESYSTISYCQAVARACERAGIEKWTPNQIRHNAATRIRSAYGIEMTRIILGHASAVTSEIYGEIDREKAREVMCELG